MRNPSARDQGPLIEMETAGELFNFNPERDCESKDSAEGKWKIFKNMKIAWQTTETLFKRIS